MKSKPLISTLLFVFAFSFTLYGGEPNQAPQANKIQSIVVWKRGGAGGKLWKRSWLLNWKLKRQLGKEARCSFRTPPAPEDKSRASLVQVQYLNGKWSSYWLTNHVPRVAVGEGAGKRICWEQT